MAWSLCWGTWGLQGLLQVSTALLGRLQKRSIHRGKAVSRRMSVWCFVDFELIYSSRGNFSASLTSFPKKPLKTGKMRETEIERRNQSFWLAPPPSALDLVKRLKVLAHLGSYISHKSECISFVTLLNTLARTMSCAVCQWRKWNKSRAGRNAIRAVPRPSKVWLHFQEVIQSPHCFIVKG